MNREAELNASFGKPTSGRLVERLMLEQQALRTLAKVERTHPKRQFRTSRNAYCL